MKEYIQLPLIVIVTVGIHLAGCNLRENEAESNEPATSIVPVYTVAVCDPKREPAEDLKTTVENAHGDLIAFYSGDDRAYHNLTHIERMLSWLDASGEHSDAVEFAIWFHDAVYDPLGSHNEEQARSNIRGELEALKPVKS